MKADKVEVQKRKLLGYSNFSAHKKTLFSHFVDYYLASPPLGNYADKGIKDYFNQVESLFSYTLGSKHGVLNLKVYNLPGKKHTFIDFSCDNMPFTEASLLNVFSLKGIYVYSQQNLILHVNYKGGKVNDILPDQRSEQDLAEESHRIIVIRFVVEFLSANERKELQKKITEVYRQIKQVTKDWEMMRGNVFLATQEYQYQYGEKGSGKDDTSKIQLLTWLTNNKCLFLGYGKYSSSGGGSVISKGSAKGLCSDALYNDAIKTAMTSITPQEGIDFMKLPVVSLIHRKVYIHCISIGIKKGKQFEEHRFLLLYSFDFFNVALEEIPYIRDHFKHQMQRLNIRANTYRWRVFRYALACYPRDEMLQVLGDKIFNRITDKIMEAFSATSFRSIVYYDKRRFFVNTAIMAPREDYSTEARHRFEKFLRAELQAGEGEFNVLFSEERLARVFLTYPLTAESPLNINTEALENTITSLGVGWRYRLRHALLKEFGDEVGIDLYKKYADIFTASYRESFGGEQAAEDLNKIIAVGSKQLAVDVNFLPDKSDKQNGYYRLRIIGCAEDSSLSNLVHILENAGAEPIASRPYFFKPCEGIISEVRLLEFNLAIRENGDDQAGSNQAEQFKESLEETLEAVYRGLAEDDGFNHLAVSASMASKDIMLLRAWANYLAQLQNNFSRDYIKDTLCSYPHCAFILVMMFNHRFNTGNSPSAYKKLEQKFHLLLEDVPSIEQDQILRYLQEVIHITVRTNFYQDQSKGYLSFKLQPNKLSFCDKLQPKYEIFIYSPDFEGVHLRDGLLARGGIRWSDKRAGYRSEVYQLVSAQIIKNAIIIPTGAKGGFYIKNQTKSAEQVYSKFIEALLDITDNYVKGKVVEVKGIKSYDEPDPYLVVAPDKGTANFSDLANEIANANKFWLGDAFASSGSTGYSHKDMGITARGAWESVWRSFAELGVDANKDPIEVIGVGDMSGDVFGNGMLLSENMRLICAFNHRNIFIDPKPDAQKSFRERSRLYNQPTSTWQDYDSSIISNGGGIFSRAEKKIKIGKVIQRKFKIKESSLSPDKLISYILKSQADLLWFGGIGTYVKSSTETNLELEDRPNDNIRVNGTQLKVKVIGEGANLGATLKGRNEFDMAGGKVATDSNDNSGGVHCSDKEVNIKILLSSLQQEGKISTSVIPKLLLSMTDEVSKSVLAENIEQNLALSLERHRAQELFLNHSHLASSMDANAVLGISDEAEYLTRPQLSILFGLVKNKIKAELAEHSLLQEEALTDMLVSYFPPRLTKFPVASIKKHFLAREILNTQIANAMVDRLGLAFWDNLTEQDWKNLPDYVIVFANLDKLFSFSHIMRELSSKPQVYPEMMKEIIKLRFSIIKLINYGIYSKLNNLKDDKWLNSARNYIDSYRKDLSLSNISGIYTEDSMKAQIHILNQGINLLMGATLYSNNLTTTSKSAMATKLVVRLLDDFDRQLAISKIIQVIDNHSSQELWQRKGLNALTMGVLEQKQRLLKSLLPECIKLSNKLKDPTGGAGGIEEKASKECLNKWKQQNHLILSSYTECINELDDKGDLTKVAYLVSLLRKL